MHDIFIKISCIFCYTKLKNTTITVGGLSLIQRDFVKCTKK